MRRETMLNFGAAMLLFVSLSSRADSFDATRIPHISGDVRVDANIDEAVWQQTTEVELPFEISPGDNISPPVATKAKIGYDNANLYIAFVAKDPRPNEIKAHLLDRDSAYSDDYVGVMLDTFDDQRRAYEFFVSPRGMQMDLIRDDTNGNEDDKWDGLWESASRITEDGYVVEMKIPFSTLRFKSGPGDKTWGLLFFRSYPRDVRHQIVSSRIERGQSCFLCAFPKYIGFEGVKPAKNIDVIPTVTAGWSQGRGAARDEWDPTIVNRDFGVDISWAPSSNVTLNATYNPDFSQIESDQIQLDFNDSFALFFDERRPFFLEGADYFDTPFSVFYSRQISDPDYGARVVGRNNNGAYGAIVAHDAQTMILVPGLIGSSFRSLDQSADVAVGRYRYDVNRSLSIGAIGTYRDGENYRNAVVGADMRWQSHSHTVIAQWLTSDSTYPDQIGVADIAPKGDAFRASYAYNTRKWFVNTRYVDVQQGFRADLGFIGQVGYKKPGIGGGFNFYRDGKKLSRITLSANANVTMQERGGLLDRDLRGSLSVNGPRQSNFGAEPVLRARLWRASLYDEKYVNLWGNFRPRPNFKVGVYANYGRQLDLVAAEVGSRQLLGLFGNVDGEGGLSFEYDVSEQRLRRHGQTAFWAYAADLRFGWQWDEKQRVRLILQGSEVGREQSLYRVPVMRMKRDIAGQLIYTYKASPRTAVYAGASYGGFLDDQHPELFASSRSAFLKWSYDWRP